MAPPAKITEETELSTLPADFGEWDSGAPPATLPDDFFDSDAPSESAPAKAVALPAEVEERAEAVSSKRERAAAEARRRAEAKAEAEAEAKARKQAEADARAEANAKKQAEAEARAEAIARKQAEAEARAEAKARKQARAEAKDEYEEEGKGKTKMVIIAIIVLALLGGGGFYAYNLRKPAPKPVVTEQTVAQPVESASLGQAGKPKPGPTPATATPTPAAETAQTATTQEPTTAPVQSAAKEAQLKATSRLAQGMKPAADTSAPPPTGGISMDMGNTTASNPFGAKPGPKVTAAAPKVINVSGSVMAGRAVSRPSPVYPSFARTARVEGTVVLHANISKAGTIENLSVISGPQMLRQAALDAVKNWRYKPYLLDNEPVEVETTVNVIFVLGR